MQEPAHRANCLFERSYSGLRVELIEYEWEPGIEIVHFEREFVLRFRLRPDRVETVGVLDGNQTTTLGRLMMRTPNVEAHSRAADIPEAAFVVSCRFEPVWFTNLVGEIDDYAMNALPEDLDIHNGDLHWTMRRIAEEIAQPSFCTDAMIEALATTAGIHLFRHRLSRDAGRQIDDHGGLSPARLRRVREFVESAMEEGPTISAIAEDLGISSSHLRRLFKNATGQTLHDYVDEARIAHAQDLLANTRIPLKVISFKVGFSHASAFSAAFRRATGESPREYRERFEARTYAVQ